QVLLISGEPGIGKTRFTQEIITQVEYSGGRSLFGASYQESNAPYEPFAQIIRSVLRQSSDDIKNIPEPIVADLIKIAPDLRAYYTDIKENPKLEGSAEQQRIFENFYLFIESLAASSPILIVLDDVHWADSATLDLSRHLMRRCKNQQVLIVGTYREVELAGSVQFQNALNGFNREGNTTRIKLGLLDKEQTHRLLTTIFDATISDDFLNGIYRETEGNPFFIEEVCKSLVDSGKLYFEDGEWHRPDMGELEIPQSVMVAIQSRVNKMSEDVNKILLLAAIIGREFDYEVLAVASELDEDKLIDIIEQAEHAQLVEELPRKGSTIFQFAHALIPATMLENVSSLRKRRIHRKVAEAMTQVKNADVSALAYHYIEAGDLVNGLKYAREAGDRATEAIANQEAITSYRLALECAEGLELSTEIITLNRLIGFASFDIDYNQSIKHYQQAYDLETDETERAGDLAMLALQYVSIGEGAIIPRLLEVLPLLKNAESHQLQYALALSAIARHHHLQTDYGIAIDYYQKSYTVLKTLDNPTELLRGMVAFCGPYQHQGQFKESSRWAEETIKLSQKEQVPITEAMGYEYLAENYSFTGKWEKGLKAGEKNLAIAKQYGFITRMGWAKFSLGYTHNYLGNLEISLQYFKECIVLAQQTGDKRLESMARTFFGRLYVDIGDQEKAITQLEKALEIANQLDEKQLFDHAYAWMSYFHWHFGDLDKALIWIRKMYDSVIDSPQRRYAMFACIFLAGILVENGTTDGIEDLLNTDWDLIINEEIIDMEALIYQIRGSAASLEGKYDEADEFFDKAMAIFEKSDTVIENGRTLLARAKMRQKQGEIEEATEDARNARDIFEKCKAANDLSKAKLFLADL
ncbi:MAG: tetratricopeptide repeat protein, partial [Chloroflexi bacterium]|nr:tetratricopeptide repeat protein [Chloroflexota bacterium]